MTAFLERLVAGAGIAVSGGPAPASGVRPRLAARFEPPAADTDGRLREHRPGPTGNAAAGEPTAPAWTEPRPVHRGVLVEPSSAVPPSSPAGAVADSTRPRSLALPPPGEWQGSPWVPVGRGATSHDAEQAAPARGAETASPAQASDAGPAPAAQRPGPPSRSSGKFVERGGRRQDDGEPWPRPAGLSSVPLQGLRPAAPPPASRPQPRRAAAAAAPNTDQPVVHVTIGRVEIRTAPAPARRGENTPPTPAAAGATGASALEHYLARRAGAP